MLLQIVCAEKQDQKNIEIAKDISSKAQDQVCLVQDYVITTGSRAFYVPVNILIDPYKLNKVS
jgi:hypothetical protein